MATTVLLDGLGRVLASSERNSQRDRAYRRLKRLLLLQQLPTGERLREEEWAEQLGIHRTALREAFARLEAESFLERGSKTGYFVPKLNREDIQQILEVRVGLEGVAVERICRLGLNTAKHLKPMREACDQLERLIGEDYALGVVESDRRFHEALVEASGNERLSTLYQRAPLPIVHNNIVDRAAWDASSRRTLDEHRAILATILDGGVARTWELLRTHLSERWLTPLPDE